jgi:hypothetical protein
MRKDRKGRAYAADRICRISLPFILHCGCLVGTLRVRNHGNAEHLKVLRDAACHAPDHHHLRYLRKECYEPLWIKYVTKDSPSSIEGVRDEKPDWSFQESSA